MRLHVTTNAKVSDGSQPPMTFDLSLSESAGSRSLDRLVERSRWAAANGESLFSRFFIDRFIPDIAWRLVY